MFGAIDGGYAVLLDELVRRADFHWAQVAVERLERREHGWQLVDDEGSAWHADAVLLAVPAPRLATIVADVAPRTAAAARRIEVASTALVALALPGGTPVPDRSGVLVAGSERLRAKAITLSSRKWGPRGNVELVRLSFGRYGDDMAHSVGDDDLLSWAADDLAAGVRRHQRAGGLSGTSVDRRDAAVRAGARRPGRRTACRPTAVARGGRRLPGRHRRARLHRGGDQSGGVPGHGTRGTIEAMARLDYDALNSTLRYLMFSVFAVRPGALGDEREAIVDETATFFKQQEDNGVVVRGLYDVAGLRADADFMIWTHAERVEALQATYSDFRRTTTLGRATTPVWSTVALHRPAEFNKSHIPAFLAGEEPGAYICVYPFVRSLDWYLLPDDERRRMLAEHGMAARDYKDVRANTVPAFALGDYEWILAFEAPELHRIVDLMRDLRATDARRHVREETPFFTGPRVGVEELVAKLP